MACQSAAKTLWITGISGFLGWNLSQRASSTWHVLGTYATRSVSLPNGMTAKLDLTDTAALREFMATQRPDAVIHTAAQSSPNYCQEHPDEAYAINVTASGAIADCCAEAAIPLVFTSTDLVFDGQHPPYRESDPVSPLSRYGEQKVQAECIILSRYPEATVCRMPLMFGYAPYASSFIQPFLAKLRAGEPLNLFTDEFRTPVSGRDAAQGLLLALDRASGVLHLGGRERLSRYEFGRLMIHALAVDQATLTPCRQSDVVMAAPRPPDVSLDSSLAYQLGYAPNSVEAELIALRGLV